MALMMHALREMALCTMAVAEGDSQRPILISCLLPVASLCFLFFLFLFL